MTRRISSTGTVLIALVGESHDFFNNAEESQAGK